METQLWKYCLVILMILVLFYLRNYIRTVILAFSLSGPPAVPLLGNVLLINDDKQLEYIGTYGHKLYGTLAKCWITIFPFFLVSDPKYLQIIMGSTKTSEKNIFYKIVHNFLGEGLITNNGEKWRHNRKLIQPCFHINVLETFVNTFAECSETFVKKLTEDTDLKVTPLINDCVLDILNRAILGASEEKIGGKSPFRKGEVVLSYRVSRPWLLLHSIFKYTSIAKNELQQKKNLQEYTRKILEKRKNGQIENESSIFRSVMEMFMELSENDPSFTEDDIINETCTFMLAGQDSVGAAVAFTLHYLAKYQDIQNKVIEEIESIFDRDKRRITINDLNEMKYLEQCIKESMRLCPSVPMMARVLREEVTLGEHTFPVGSNFLIMPFATHRLPNIFPDPLAFKPERFAPENLQNMHPYAFMAFSMGPRNCIGFKYGLLEMKTIISTLLREYTFSLIDGHRELQLSYRVTLRCKGGIWLRFKKRLK